MTQLAFYDFIETIDAKFGKDDLNKPIAYFMKMLLPTQDFALLFATLSIEYLGVLLAADDSDFNAQLKDARDAFVKMKTFLLKGEELIVEEFWSDVKQYPCYNYNDLRLQMEEW